MSDASHWEAVYAGKAEEQVSWFEAHPALSFDLISRFVTPGEPIVDVGGGASRLVDLLVEAELGPVTVLDLSSEALEISKARLNADADLVQWVAGDVTTWQPDTAFVLWHDRAVFHFLTELKQQAAYVESLTKALKIGGIAIIATFAEDGPERCSGLPVQRYSGESLEARFEELAPGQYERVETIRHKHDTPAGVSQQFQTTVFRKL